MKKKLLENPTIDRPSLESAYNFAKSKHDATGITRRATGEPYFVHPEMVADLVAVYGGSDDQITAALLHDTVEDTDTTFEELEALYGVNVAEMVSELTNYRPEIERVGKEAYINQELCELSNDALLVKCADCVINYLDHPTVAQKDRLIRNLTFMLEHREAEIPRNVKQLLKSVPELDEFSYMLDTNEGIGLELDIPADPELSWYSTN